jgi:hypothetical protein
MAQYLIALVNTMMFVRGHLNYQRRASWKVSIADSLMDNQSDIYDASSVCSDGSTSNLKNCFYKNEILISSWLLVQYVLRCSCLKMHSFFLLIIL